MLNSDLVHPQLLRALALAGHGATLLLADGHYPASTAVGPHAETVHLNLRPGLVDVVTVLDLLVPLVPIEAATVMVPPPGDPEPAPFADYRQRLPGLSLQTLDRYGFYEAARSTDLALVVVTADVRQYANLLLTVGVRQL
jgi:L-fucose mutarotase